MIRKFTRVERQNKNMAHDTLSFYLLWLKKIGESEIVVPRNCEQVNVKAILYGTKN